MNPSPNKPQEQPSAKKPYDAPRLQVYGSLREITNNVSTLGHVNDDFIGNTRTR